MRRFFEAFAYCPRCGARYGADAFDPARVVFDCAACAYEFYQNAVPSVTAVIPAAEDLSRILLIERRTAPHVGMLALPGGFLEYGEHPASAVVREIEEETLIRTTVDRLLCTTMVDYQYKGDRICILELGYLMRPVPIDPGPISTSEACRVEFVDARAVSSGAQVTAFPEHARVVAHYLAHLDLAARGRDLVCETGGSVHAV